MNLARHVVVLLTCTLICASAPSQTPSAELGKSVTFSGIGVTLDGTLIVPKSVKGGACPAVLLLPGSGPTDRDENVLPAVRTDLLKEIAERLAAVGVATFRFDKRAVAHYRPIWPKTMAGFNDFDAWDNFVGDATAALQFLRVQPGVDPQRVSILGHSEGALIALQIAHDSAGTTAAPASLALLSGPGRTMRPVLHEQIARLLDQQGAGPTISKQYLDWLDKATSDLAAGKDYPSDVPVGLKALFNPTITKYLQALCRIEPTKLAANYLGPVLIVNGKEDVQVSAERDAQRLFAAFQARAHGQQTLVIVPNTSHFLKASGSAPDAMSGPMAPMLWDALKAFFAP